MIRNVCICLLVIIQLAVLSIFTNKPVQIHDSVNIIDEVEADDTIQLDKIEEESTGEDNSIEAIEEFDNELTIQQMTALVEGNKSDDIDESLGDEEINQENVQKDIDIDEKLVIGDNEIALPEDCFYEAKLRFNIRKEPDINSEVIGKIPSGSIMRIISVANEEWCYIDYNGQEGFCNTEIIRACCSFQNIIKN